MSENLLGFERPNGWHAVISFDEQPVDLPPGEVLITSGPLTADGRLPAETTAWLRRG